MRGRQKASGLLYRIGTPVMLAPRRVGRRSLSLVLIGVIIVVTIAIRLISSPAHGHQVAVDKKYQPKKIVTVVVPASTISNNYFKLDLPVGYKQQPAQAATGILFAETIIKPSTEGSLIIAIGIQNLPEGGVVNDPSYHARQLNTARYTFSTKTLHGETVNIASDMQGSSTAAFWPHGGYLASIGVSSGFASSGGDNSDQLRALETLLNAWQWQ